LAVSYKIYPIYLKHFIDFLLFYFILFLIAPVPPMMLSRPLAGAGAPGTIPAPGLSAPPPGIGSALPGMGAPGVHPPQHYPPIGGVTNASSSLPLQPSRGVKRQMEE